MQEYQERDESPQKSEEPENDQNQDEEEEENPEEPEEEPEPEPEPEPELPPLISTDDDLLVRVYHINQLSVIENRDTIYVINFLSYNADSLSFGPGSFVQGLREINPQAAELEESNALALAIIQPGNFKHIFLRLSVQAFFYLFIIAYT